MAPKEWFMWTDREDELLLNTVLEYKIYKTEDDVNTWRLNGIVPWLGGTTGVKHQTSKRSLRLNVLEQLSL